MKTFTSDQISTMRGVNALTQGETTIEELLLYNCNELQNTRRGFNATRVQVLETMDDAIFVTWTKMCIEVTEEQMKQEPVKMALLYLAEKMIRDHCTHQAVAIFVRNTVNRYNIFGKDFNAVVDSIAKYLRCGYVVPVIQSMKEAEKELAEGKVVYHVPTAV